MRLRIAHAAGAIQRCACISLSKVFLSRMRAWSNDANGPGTSAKDITCVAKHEVFLNPAHLFSSDYVFFCMRETLFCWRPECVKLLRLER